MVTHCKYCGEKFYEKTNFSPDYKHKINLGILIKAPQKRKTPKK